MTKTSRTSTSAAAVIRGPEVELSGAAQAFLEREVVAGRALVVDRMIYVPFGPGRAVPAIVEYEGHGPFGWSLIAAWDGTKHRCVALHLEAPKEGHISAEDLRAIPLGALVEQALLFRAIRVDEENQPLGKIVADSDVSLADARKLHDAVLREHRRRSRGVQKAGRVTDEKLKLAASVYLKNLNSAPVQAVALHFIISRSSAGRWIGEARRRGHLPAAPGRGRAGVTLEDDQNNKALT